MIYNIKSPTDLSGLYIVYDGSTLLEGPGIRGASHLLEHLMCKSFEDLQDELQRKGIQWNAYTSINEVVFWFTGLEEKLGPYRSTLMKRLERFEITQEQFETERKIVLQEYKDAMTDQYWTHYYNVMRRRFGFYDAIGLKEDLDGLTLQEMQRLFSTWYARPTKIINVSAGYHHMDTKKLGNNQLAGSVLQDYPDQDPTLEMDSHHEGTSSVRFISEPITQDVPALKIIGNMLTNGLQSPLVKLIRETHGLCYFISAGTARYNQEAIFVIGSTTADETVDKMIGLVQETLDRVTDHLTPERLEVVREMLQIEDRMSAINRYTDVHPWLSPPQFQARAVQDTITIEEVHRVAKLYLHPDRLAVSVDKRDFRRP